MGGAGMELRRRGFLATAGTVGAAGLLFPTLVLGQTLPSPEDLDTLEDFRARLKDWLYLFNSDPGQQGDLRLIAVEDRGTTAQLQQFALTLRSRRGALALPSGLYEVAGQQFSLSIKHTHEQRDKQFYTAEFALLMQ